MNCVISSGRFLYSLKRPLSPALLAMLFAGLTPAAEPANPPTANSVLPPVTLTVQQDHQRLKDLLHISALRPGRNGNNPQATNYANYDESKANPYPNLPDPLVLKKGQKVTTEAMWWSLRRPEIVEDFDREIYGRVPKHTPKVNWEITKTTRETNGTVAVITKQLVGHVDNSTSYELVALCAPRPVFLSAGATHGDGWVDAKGTFLAGVGAGPAYKLLDKKDLGTTEFPDIETPLTDGDVAFRQHSGGHVDGPNWPVFLAFASRYIKGPPVASRQVATAPK